MVGGQQIMGNFRPAAGMTTFQGYTGAGDNQRSKHFKNIGMGDRSNFYMNV